MNQEDNIYGVMDGATGLDGMPGDIASNQIKEGMMTPYTKQTLFERITAANQQVAKEIIRYYKKNIGLLEKDTIDEIEKTQRSSTGVATIQLNEAHTSFDYIHAGDCMIFLQYDNGDIRSITYDLISDLDHQAIKEMICVGEENDTLRFEERLQQIQHTLKENRNKLNTNEGYGIIDGSAEALEHLEYGRITLKKVKKILLVSDGLQMPCKLSEDNVWEKTALYCFTHGLDNLLQEINKREAEDPDCTLYPRLKPADDKTGILLEF